MVVPLGFLSLIINLIYIYSQCLLVICWVDSQDDASYKKRDKAAIRFIDQWLCEIILFCIFSLWQKINNSIYITYIPLTIEYDTIYTVIRCNQYIRVI